MAELILYHFSPPIYKNDSDMAEPILMASSDQLFPHHQNVYINPPFAVKLKKLLTST